MNSFFLVSKFSSTLSFGIYMQMNFDGNIFAFVAIMFPVNASVKLLKVKKLLSCPDV